MRVNPICIHALSHTPDVPYTDTTLINLPTPILPLLQTLTLTLTLSLSSIPRIGHVEIPS